MHLILALVHPAPASEPLELVPRGGSHKRMATSVSTGGATITPAEFTATILDCSKYPLTASYMGVVALVECRSLEKRADGYRVVYQRTGGNAFVSSRHYVIALRVEEQTADKARVEWDLVKHEGSAGAWTGPYASALNAHPEAVLPTYNTGGWALDTVAGTIAYEVTSDPGGTVPGWMVSEGALLAFPLELLRARWGVEP